MLRHPAKTSYALNLNSWISVNPNQIRSINIFKSIVLFSHPCLLNNNRIVASTTPKSTATFFALSRILTFLTKTGKASSPSSENPGSPPRKNNCTRMHAHTTTRTFNRISRRPSPTTPKSLQYATSIVPTISTSASPQTNATYAILVATTTTAVPHCIPHHRVSTSGVTIIVVLADTALPSAEPNSQTQNIFNSYNNSRSHS